ncbi:peptidase [Streptomyces mobaraensis NBRC 13819 = DSM 40847]|uniref:Clp protease N-terminal domain-containing protein n=1 Tax=Streptomyces mobaraensis TaxID=35621 RepID=UPI00034B82FF|nr:Clp protease N-terminal domain-containing protein [Streptomyces mobaraensis]QTT72723.1 peptidase [Streptomyces mobaraensis NBRC 13819 = DSM 40847]
MQSRTPDIGGADEVPLSTEVAAAVAGARRRALRDGDRQIDTAHLLHSLLEADPETRLALPGGPDRLVRLLGYLVQRSIGYGLRWRGRVEDSRALPLLPEGGVPGWSPAAAIAMGEAYARAAVRGPGPVEGLDLLHALALDPRCRAVEVLERAGIDAEGLCVRPGAGRWVRSHAGDGPVGA